MGNARRLRVSAIHIIKHDFLGAFPIVDEIFLFGSIEEDHINGAGQFEFLVIYHPFGSIRHQFGKITAEIMEELEFNGIIFDGHVVVEHFNIKMHFRSGAGGGDTVDFPFAQDSFFGLFVVFVCGVVCPA